MYSDLKQRQIDVLQYIQKFIAEYKYSPTVREICNGVGLSSTSTVSVHLNILESKGYITKNETIPRSIVPTDKCIPIVPPDPAIFAVVPVVENISADMPIFAKENISGYFPVAKDAVDEDDACFMYRMKDESLINAGILEGDYILVRLQDYANDGDTVVAIVNNSMVTRTYHKENDCIKLRPENDVMEPIIATDVDIIGKVTGNMRMYM